MENSISKKILANKLKKFISINDLRDKDYNGVNLTPQESLALKNYDRYRIKILSQQLTEKKFHDCYLKLQVMANLSPFEEFLKEDYFN